MQISQIRATPTHIRVRLVGSPLTYKLPRGDLYGFAMGIEELLLDHGIAAVIPPMPAFRPDWREFLQLSEIHLQDADSFNREAQERNEEAARSSRRNGEPHRWQAGGAWYAEVVVNGIPNDLSFNTVEEFFTLLMQIIIRECAVMVGGPAPTVPGVVGNG